MNGVMLSDRELASSSSTASRPSIISVIANGCRPIWSRHSSNMSSIYGPGMGKMTWSNFGPSQAVTGRSLLMTSLKYPGVVLNQIQRTSTLMPRIKLTSVVRSRVFSNLRSERVGTARRSAVAFQ